MDVAVLVLHGGQNIIGRVVKRDEDEGSVVLSNIRTLIPVPQPGGRVSMSMFPFLMFSTSPDAEVEFCAPDYIVEMPNVMQGVADAYTQDTSGIAIAR